MGEYDDRSPTYEAPGRGLQEHDVQIFWSGFFGAILGAIASWVGVAMAERFRRNHEQATKLRILKAWAKAILSMCASQEKDLTGQLSVVSLLAQRLANLSIDWKLFEALRTEAAFAAAIELQGAVTGLRAHFGYLANAASGGGEFWKGGWEKLPELLADVSNRAAILISEIESAEVELSPTAD